jgi:hypothetical protein
VNFVPSGKVITMRSGKVLLSGNNQRQTVLGTADHAVEIDAQGNVDKESVPVNTDTDSHGGHDDHGGATALKIPSADGATSEIEISAKGAVGAVNTDGAINSKPINSKPTNSTSADSVSALEADSISDSLSESDSFSEAGESEARMNLDFLTHCVVNCCTINLEELVVTLKGSRTRNHNVFHDFRFTRFIRVFMTLMH